MKPSRLTLTRAPFCTQCGQWRAMAKDGKSEMLVTFPYDPGPLEPGATVTAEWTMTGEWRAKA